MPTIDFVISARNIEGKGSKQKFGNENADCSYLEVPDPELPNPSHCVPREKRDSWAKRVIKAARQGLRKGEFGHILFFVHGFNGDLAINMRRHRRLRDDLAGAGFKGVVVSFDWPCGDIGAFYLEDLKDAHDAAHQLVKDAIVLLAEFQEPDCVVNVHVLAHSMGAYVTREAFTWADDIDDVTGKSWHVSQIMLIAGDISARSMRASDPRSDTLYRVSNRVTNYSSHHDSVLGLSNVKRAGVAPRVGRVGLPDDAPDKAVNVDCSDYWKTDLTDAEKKKSLGNPAHSWHIGNPVFTRDMIDTMNGVDRSQMVTRVEDGKPNRFRLTQPATPVQP